MKKYFYIMLLACVSCSKTIVGSSIDVQCPEVIYPEGLINKIYAYEEEQRRSKEVEMYGHVISEPLNKDYLSIVTCDSFDDKCFGIYVYSIPDSTYIPEGNLISCGEDSFNTHSSREKPFCLIGEELVDYKITLWVDPETGHEIANISNYVYPEGTLSREEMRIVSESYSNTPSKCI